MPVDDAVGAVVIVARGFKIRAVVGSRTELEKAEAYVVTV